MTDWVVVLTPFLVLPIVLLFRFVGCALVLGIDDRKLDPGPAATDPAPEPPPEPGPTPPPPTPPPTPTETKPPNYRKYILGEQPNPGLVNAFPGVVPNGADVIAYWRLVDAAASVDAVDEKAFQKGDYKQGHTLPTVNPTTTVAGSEGRTPAKFVTGQSSLIDSDPAVKGRFFDGGYVLVPYKPGLFSEQCTLEAWIRVDLLAANFEHTLFDAGGDYGSPAGTPNARRGFRIFADRTGHWQVRMAAGPGGAFANLFAAPPLVPLGKRTHVAVTVAAAAGTAKTVSLYVDGKLIDTASLPKYDPPYDAPLFIGVENTQNDPTDTPTLRTPLLCQVQEVVLHRKALSPQEIANHVDINRA